MKFIQPSELLGNTNKFNARENPAKYVTVIARPNTGQIGSATHGGSGNVTTTTQHPQHPSRDGIQQLYGHSEYPSGSGSYPSQPAGHVTYPKEAAYPSSFRYSYNSSQNGRQAPCLTATPPHPSFQSFVGQKNVAASAPRRRKCIERDEGICALFSLFCSI